MRDIGRLRDAETEARNVISNRAHGRARSKAFGQILLASILAAQGNLHEACATARDVLDSTTSVSSYLIVGQLRAFRHDLANHSRIKGVAEFIAQLDETLGRRTAQMSAEALPAARG